MTRQQSLELTLRIGEAIRENRSRITYTAHDVKEARKALGEDSEHLKAAGILGEDFELFYCLNCFADRLGLWEAADLSWLGKLFSRARKLTPSWFYSNDYIRQVKVPNAKEGRFTLTSAFYEPGEWFQYDMPDLNEKQLVPYLGFFTGKVTFPGIYEDEIPWMSVCPSEIFSMEKPIRQAHGRVLVLGLGLGYYPFQISLRKEVETITIVEISDEILKLFENYLLPQFPEREKIHLVKADAFEFIKDVQPGEYDFCFADIWENEQDGAEAYEKLLPQSERLSSTEFSWWIEDAIRSVLDEKEYEKHLF